MSDPLRITIVGATGLIGSSLVRIAAFDPRYRVSALARRELPIPAGARIEVLVVEPARWEAGLNQLRPRIVVNALGTTWKKSGQDEAAFCAVDHDLVLDVARAARAVGAERFVHISSVGADPASRAFYLRTKGEVERELAKLKLRRLDILQPGLLRGSRSGDRRAMERLGILASPLTNLLLHGNARRFRAIDATVVARAALGFALEKAAGRFIHENDELHRAARRFVRETPTGVD